MRKALFLCGVKGLPSWWEALLTSLLQLDADCPAYPYELTTTALTVDEYALWAARYAAGTAYDAIIGHSLGGLVALRLGALPGLSVGRVVCLDTSLRPAQPFYRNLLTPAHQEAFGTPLLAAMREEGSRYHPSLLASLREDFDDTPLLAHQKQKPLLIYGDRGQPAYPHRIDDLNLPPAVLAQADLAFLPNACHMLMLENPTALAALLSCCSASADTE